MVVCCQMPETDNTSQSWASIWASGLRQPRRHCTAQAGSDDAPEPAPGLDFLAAGASDRPLPIQVTASLVHRALTDSWCSRSARPRSPGAIFRRVLGSRTFDAPPPYRFLGRDCSTVARISNQSTRQGKIQLRRAPRCRLHRARNRFTMPLSHRQSRPLGHR